MPDDDLAKRIDAFELELTCMESLIDILYVTPTYHPYHARYLEDLHTHRLNMREKYDDIRSEMIGGVVG